MAKVLIPLADGFEEIEALSVVDIMRRGGVEIVTASTPVWRIFSAMAADWMSPPAMSGIPSLRRRPGKIGVQRAGSSST